MSKPYQMCTRCVMDTSAGDIQFDAQGVCNYCTTFLQHSGHILHAEPAERLSQLNAFVERVKRDGQGKRYDCVVGVSGGVDSSWVLVRAVELGLRPLAVHMDNGWNSELAQNNIANLVQGLGVDLHTHVIDWPEYRALMQAFFDADVIDVELLYDNAMLAVNYQQAAQHGVKWILSGSNQATEGLSIPKSWNWFKHDQRNIRAIAKAHGNVKIRTLPTFGTLQYVLAEFVRRIKWTQILNLMEYNKFDAMRALKESHGYKPYPYKHYESIFTRFYQGYLLPQKFGADKRRVHFSTLIVAGQMTREEAIRDLENIPYPSQAELDDDRQYFLKKMGWTEAQLQDYLNRPERPHTAYPSEIKLWNLLKDIYLRFRR